MNEGYISTYRQEIFKFSLIRVYSCNIIFYYHKDNIGLIWKDRYVSPDVANQMKQTQHWEGGVGSKSL